MELRQLEMLQAVVECGGYKAAGERLHVSHPAVHRQVRLLEGELGERLFLRVGRHVQLTEAGWRLRTLAERLHQEIGSALSDIRNLTELESGEVRLGTATTMLMFFLPRVVQRFRRHYPKVSVRLSTNTTREIFSDVSNGNLDLGIVFSLPGPAEPKAQVCRELLYEEEFVLAVSDSHPLARRKMIVSGDLTDIALITYSRQSTLRRYIESRLASVGVELPVVMELENEETIAKMLQMGGSAAFLSRRRAIADNIRHFRIRDLLLRCAVSLVYLKKTHLSRASAEFARFCREECAA